MSLQGARAGALATALALAGVHACAPDPEANEGFVDCGGDADCPAGRVCVRGFCVVPGADGGVELCDPDAGVVSCYTGPEGTQGVGACRPGERECIGGVLTSCLGEVLPGPEICNGIDDSCDGRIDVLGQTTCDTGMRGACATGELVCRGTTAACDPLEEPQPEVCDGKDNNCDGHIDEGIMVRCYPEGQVGCADNGDGTFTCMGQCRPGTAPCVDGQPGACADAVTPDPEACDGMDNNCSGVIDDVEGGCVCEMGDLQSCYGGPSGTVYVGACLPGTQTCGVDGRFGPCMGEVRPAPETCLNLGEDTDCDGEVGNVPGLGDPCVDEQALGVCRRGTVLCNGGEAPECVTPEPSPEVCDGRDNNCNGVVDDGFDLLNDPENCGECGNVCGTGLTCCRGQCMNLQTSDDACGACGNACGSGRTCCAGACVDVQRNSLHCGECGSSCGSSQICCDARCTDTRSDPDHCGACGQVCGSGQDCCDGDCASPASSTCADCPMTCPSGTECCGNVCVDTDTDSSHCGDCGAPCGTGEICCDGDCVSQSTPDHCGQCGRTCGDGQRCCGGACVDEDEANCGECGEVCDSTERCCEGECTSILTEDDCGACGEVCPDGQHCSRRMCCPEGNINCGGTCVDLDTNAAHCGACGFACTGNGGPPEQCTDGCCCRSVGAARCRCP
jgi:hypothetical protein